MRNINLEANIWNIFTSVAFIQAAAKECDESREWFGNLAISRKVSNFGRNGQVFEKLHQRTEDFQRAAELARLGDYRLAWKIAGYIRGDVRGILDQPFHAWMSEAEYDDFFSRRIGRITGYATRIERALTNAMVGAGSFFSPDVDHPERSNDDDGFAGDEIIKWCESDNGCLENTLFSTLPDPIPMCRIEKSVSCKTGDEVPWTGVWYPSTGLENHSLTFAIKGLRMQPAYRVIKTREELKAEGRLVPYPKTIAVATTWHPVISCASQEAPQGELRAKAGQPCPKAGVWQQVDTAATERRYEAGDTMANRGSAYGLTVWRWMSD